VGFQNGKTVHYGTAVFVQTRHRNADALSRRPVNDDCSTDEEPRQCKTVACRTEAVREQSDTKPRVQAPAGESLTKLQRQDPDSHIDKLKTRETDNHPKSWVTDDFDRRTDDAGVAGDRDRDNGDVGINDPGPGGDDDVTTPKHQPTSSERLNDVAYIVQNDEYHDDDIRHDTQNDATKDLYTIAGDPCSSTPSKTPSFVVV